MKNRKVIKRIISTAALVAVNIQMALSQITDQGSQEVRRGLQEFGVELYQLVFVIAGLGAIAGLSHVAWAYFSDNSQKDPAKLLKNWGIGLAVVAFGGLIIYWFTGIDFRS